MGHDSQARLEVQLALQKRALHRRESLKYQNLVALRDTLQEAHRNLSLAQIMQEGTGAIQAQLHDLSKADLRALQKSQGAREEQDSSLQPLLVTMEENHEEVHVPTVTEDEVAAQLALLRLPPTPTTIAVSTTEKKREAAICK